MNKISRVPPGLLCRAAAMAVMLSCGQFAWAADYTHEILSDNPIGYWQFEETTGLAIDSSPTGADGTYGAGITPGLFPGAFSIGGKSASFDGASFIDLPGIWGGAGMTEVTLEAWVNTAENTGNFQTILGGNDPNSFAHFSLHSGGNSVIYTGTNASVVALPIVSAEPTETWRHIVITSKSGESKVYVDGVQFGATAVDTYTNVGESDSLNIGVGHLGGRFFSGLMDEVAIYDTALSPERVLAHYEAAGATPPPPPPPPAAATLISHWTFDDDASDSVGGHNGTLEGGASITTDARVGGGALDLRTASGAEFGYVNVATEAIAGLSEVSVAMFVNMDALAPGCCTALLANNGWSNAGAGAAGTLHLNLAAGTGVPEFAINNNPAGAWGRDPAAPVPLDGTWVHLAFTYDKATGMTTPYVNGVAGTPGTGGLADIGLGPLWIGGWDVDAGRHPNARIDDLRIYSGVLTPEEVADLAAVPEPSSLLLLSLGLSGLGVFTRRRNRK